MIRRTEGERSSRRLVTAVPPARVRKELPNEEMPQVARKSEGVWKGGEVFVELPPSRGLACAWRPQKPVPTRRGSCLERMGATGVLRRFLSVELVSARRMLRGMPGDGRQDTSPGDEILALYHKSRISHFRSVKIPRWHDQKLTPGHGKGHGARVRSATSSNTRAMGPQRRDSAPADG